MAKRKYSMTKRNKIEPAVQTISLSFQGTTPYFPEGSASLATYFVDLSQIASVVNRRFYRQGINWAVAGIKVTAASGSGGDVRVSKLPNTWVMSNAWEKSFRVWQKMTKDALEESQSVRPRFMDFKIYANNLHQQSGFANNVRPIDAEGNAYVMGEWEASKIYLPQATNAAAATTTDCEFVAVGPSYGTVGASGLSSVSLIEGYANSRSLPNRLDPNTPDDADDVSGVTPENWMSAVFNEGNTQTQEVIGDMIDENNQAPYPFEGDGTALDTMYPGGGIQAPTLELHDLSTITATTVGAMTRLKGGNFPCGLMVFQFDDLTGVPFIQIDLVPGPHRGYLCEPMTEM